MKRFLNYINVMKFAAFLFLAMIFQLNTLVHAQTRVVVPNGTQISDNSTPNSLQPLPFSLLDLSSSERGFLMPRMTTAERSAIPKASLTSGLIIFNTTMDCVEFYNGTRDKWMNMCGDVEPAIFTIPADKCNSIKVSGDYVKGVILNERKHLITLEVNVSTPGTFDIEAVAYDNTGVENGYGFSAEGVFPTAGNFLIVLKGQGKPKVGYADVNTKDVIKFSLNRKLVSCTTENYVKPDYEPLALSFVCNDATHPVRTEGTYKINESVSSGNRIVVPFTVTKPGRGRVYGEIPISGKQTELIQYESETIDFRETLPGTVQDVVLYPVQGTGMPTTAGNLTGSLKMISKGKHEYDPIEDPVVQEVSGCSFSIDVERGIAQYTMGKATFNSNFLSKTYKDPVFQTPVPYITPSTDMSKASNNGNFWITVNVDVTQPGDYEIKTDTRNGVYFYNRGTWDDRGATTVTLYAYGVSGLDMPAGTGNFFTAYDEYEGGVGNSNNFSGKTKDIDFVYRPMKMYSIGGPSDQSWHPGGFNGPLHYWFAGPRVVRQKKHFSWNGTVRIDGLEIIGITNLEQTGAGVDYRAHLTGTGTAFGSNLNIADMVFIGSSGDNNWEKNSLQLDKLVTFIQYKGGSVVYGEGDKDYLKSFLNKISGGSGISVTSAGSEGPFTVVPVANSASELILGKQGQYFSTGDAYLGLYGKYLGSHNSGTSVSMTGLPSNFISLASTSSGSFSFVHKDYGLVVVGSSTFMGGYVDNRSTSTAYPLNASTNGDPLIKKFGSKGDVYNSWFLLNLVHWAIDHAQANKANNP